MDRVRISKKDLEELFNNKQELLFFFEHVNQLFLPSKSFLDKQILGVAP
jgi:hypothetical protein